jgi:hypothetical protein
MYHVCILFINNWRLANAAATLYVANCTLIGLPRQGERAEHRSLVPIIQRTCIATRAHTLKPVPAAQVYWSTAVEPDPHENFG